MVSQDKKKRKVTLVGKNILKLELVSFCRQIFKKRASVIFQHLEMIFSNKSQQGLGFINIDKIIHRKLYKR